MYCSKSFLLILLGKLCYIFGITQNMVQQSNSVSSQCSDLRIIFAFFCSSCIDSGLFSHVTSQYELHLDHHKPWWQRMLCWKLSGQSEFEFHQNEILWSWNITPSVCHDIAKSCSRVIQIQDDWLIVDLFQAWAIFDMLTGFVLNNGTLGLDILDFQKSI